MNRSFQTAIFATTHCLVGCSIGEVLGMILATYFGLSNFNSILLSIILAFVFGYSLTLLPLLRHGLSIRKSLGIAIASDSVSITSMEVMDNLVIILIPSALNAKLNDILFWESLVISLFVAFLVTVPVNYLFINKGMGHAHSHNH